MRYHGRVLTVGDHIDTDAIIPARLLVTADPAILGKHCMSGLEEGWAERIRPGDILVAGENFGCGSSREHAPIAILGAGIKVVIAASFARIFYRNAFNVGLPLLEAGAAARNILEGHEVDVDTTTGSIRNLTTGETIACPPLPDAVGAILAAGGLEPYVRMKLEHARG